MAGWQRQAQKTVKTDAIYLRISGIHDDWVIPRWHLVMIVIISGLEGFAVSMQSGTHEQYFLFARTLVHFDNKFLKTGLNPWMIRRHE